RERVDEWPDEADNLAYRPIHVVPTPLPDLVVHDVVAPPQVTAGGEARVQFTVTNRGPGDTGDRSWVDTIWLTRDRNRPPPRDGDILLTSRPRSGDREGARAGDDGGGYDGDTLVTVPGGVDAGEWFITPWADPYDAVLEDTLADNDNGNG